MAIAYYSGMFFQNGGNQLQGGNGVLYVEGGGSLTLQSDSNVSIGSTVGGSVTAGPNPAGFGTPIAGAITQGSIIWPNADMGDGNGVLVALQPASAPGLAGSFGLPLSDYWGSGGQQYLSTPDAWINVQVDGSQYAMPCYVK